VAALYAATVAASRIASILAHADARLKTIHLLAEILPPVTQMVVFFLIYGLVVWRFVDVFRESTGAQRVYFALFFADLLLYPLRIFLPSTAAICVLFVQALANVVMFPAAVHMFIQLGTSKQTQQQSS